MKAYSVIWNDTKTNRNGRTIVYANSEQEAVANARNLLQMGSAFRVVMVYEMR